ncbi:dTDP-glucose 4,6-dehydratase [uncultured Parasutterella sp.]|uniref:dTDP-glucose 4,6-dehydratase n=1 Tax=uncultured Parasutterella sp. TaxID=1263098 RepID=UPI0025B67820|nr:dTDP-glucose 4,6-dehydratase [uncultured Parasutterella sp.]
MKILVTGGCGFIGSAFILQQLSLGRTVLNLDVLSYAGNPENLYSAACSPNYYFAHGDIGDRVLVSGLLQEFCPDAVVNFAAETHVDRSIVDPTPFFKTNAYGTASLLIETLNWWKNLSKAQRESFRFLHISTDEVFGSLSGDEAAFSEESPYRPRSPYSASKAAADFYVRSFHETYGLPTLITNCSNNYGPRQYPEKFIPLLIINALQGKRLPIYGNGANIRDWLYVEDHCQAIDTVLTRSHPGETYNIGGNCEQSNLDIAHAVTKMLDKIKPRADKKSYSDQIAFVKDRPGHDFRYAINTEKICRDFGWRPTHTLASGLHDTIIWYLANNGWLETIKSRSYKEWYELNYAEPRFEDEK